MSIRVLFIVRDLASAEPLGLMQLAALLKGAGHGVRLVGAATAPLPPLLASYRPQLVGYSVCTGEHRPLLALNRRLKRDFNFISIFGGPHPTFFPEMSAEEGVDIICRGEGDGAIIDLAAALDEGRSFAEIPNLWVNSKDRLITPPEASAHRAGRPPLPRQGGQERAAPAAELFRIAPHRPGKGTRGQNRGTTPMMMTSTTSVSSPPTLM